MTTKSQSDVKMLEAAEESKTFFTSESEIT